MKSLFLRMVCITILALISNPLFANPNKTFGLGIILGEPTGFSAKLNLSQKVSIDGALAWSLDGDTSFHLHSDLLFHSRNIFRIDADEIQTKGFDLYYGAGARIRFRDNPDDQVGIRVPIGLEYNFDFPIGVFLEFAGIMNIVPNTDFSFNAGIGARYFF